MALLEKDGVNRRERNVRGKTPQYARMPRDYGRIIIDPAKLRYWRQARLMTRGDLAEATHMSLDSVRSYERGRRFPKRPAFRRLVTALGLSPEDLLFEDCRYIREDGEGNQENG